MLPIKRHRGESTLADFDPFGALSLLDEWWPTPFRREEEGGLFVPAMDVSETDKEYKVRLEVPGMKKEDIKIEFEGNVLTLSGEKKSTTEEKGEKIYRVERRYGAFSRSLRFKDIDGEGIKANYKDGVLEVIVPKTEAAQPKRISVE